MPFDFDLLVIGAGSGGVRAARMAAAKGAKVAIIEEKYFGGTCVNVGCIPKKLLAYAAHFSDDFDDASGFGWQLGETRHDWKTLINNKNAEISRLNQIYINLLEKAGVEIMSGRAVFADANTVLVGEKSISAERILLAVGSEPVIPDIEGKEHAITSDQVFYLDERPEQIVIVGGGYIAVEFSSIFNGLGSKVNLVYRGDKLLKGFDRDMVAFTLEEMEKKGVRIHLHSTICCIEPQQAGYSCVLQDGSHLRADKVLYATGRRPVTDRLKLANTNVHLNADGTIRVDENFQTDEPSIFALGDVIGTPELTPVALEQAMVLVDHLYGEGKREMSYEAIPTTVFCQPNLAVVGLTEEEVREKGIKAEVFISEFRPLKHTLSGSSERMKMKMLVDRVSQRLLGVHIAGADAGEILQGFAVLVKAGVTKQQVDATLGIHPTAAEELVTLRQASYLID